ncbi:hypothetical protein [Priestia megaterium]|uniref:hypothetical protein n=1 Tax=Priestia megaterium TaxID=1404 RepID=UPI00301D5267
MIGGQGEDSCGKSGTGETPQERKRRGGSAAARGKRSHARAMHGNQPRCPKQSILVPLFNLLIFRWG